MNKLLKNIFKLYKEAQVAKKAEIGNELKEIAPQLKYVHITKKHDDSTYNPNIFKSEQKTISFDEALKLAGEDLWNAIDRAVGHLFGYVKLDNGEEIKVDSSDFRKKNADKKQNVSKKAEENDGYITVWLWPGAGYLLNGFATQASSESEALDNVAQYLSDNNMGKYYETEEEHFNRIKEDNPDLSDEELFEIEHNDPTSIYVDNSMGFIGWINSENMKFTNGIDEQHIDQITIIDGPRKNASKKIKLSKKANSVDELKNLLNKDDRVYTFVFSDDNKKVNIRIFDSKMGYQKTGFIPVEKAFDIDALMKKVNADGKEMDAEKKVVRSSKVKKLNKKAWTELEKKQVGALEDKETGKYNIYQTNGGEIVLTNHKLDSKKYALMDTANTFEELVEKQEKNWEDSYTLYDKALLPEFEKHFGVEIELDPDVENDTLENYNFFDLTKDYVEETKEAATNKKAEEDLIQVGWDLISGDEDMIKSLAEDTGRRINKNFWDKINKDIVKVENWFLTEGYKQYFTKVRDEGHGSDDGLGGAAWMTKQQMQDFISQAEKYDENSYALFESMGTLDINISHDDAVVFHLYIYIDDKDLDKLGIEAKKVNKNKKQSSKTKSMRKRAGYSNNPNYFGDWFGKGQIDFTQIINPNDSGDVYMVKIWGGSGYILDVYLVKAQDEYEAIDKVFEWSYENEGANKLIFDYADIEKEAVEYYKDEPDMFDKEMTEEDFIDRFMGEYYVANSDYSLFARSENFFVGKVPEEYLTKKETNASNKQKLNKKATKTLEEVAVLIDTILDDFDHYDYADQLEVGEHSLYEDILADVQKDEKGTIESLFARIKEDDSDELFTSKELVQLKEYYNNKFGKTATTKQAQEKLYKAMWYDSKGNKKSEFDIGKSSDINELKENVRDFLFEKRKIKEEINPNNNSFLLRDKIVIEDYYTGEPIETIKVSDLLSTYGRDYWKPFMEAKATKKKAVLQVSENGMGYVLPNGTVVYPENIGILRTELRDNKRLLKEQKEKLEKLEKHIQNNPRVNFGKFPGDVFEQRNILKQTIEYLEEYNETIEEILNAFKENKLPRQATKKQAKKLEFEDDIVEVTDKKGKVIYEGMFDYLDYDMKEDFYDTAKTKWIGNKYKISLPNGEYYLKVKGHKNNKLDKQATIKHENGVYNVYSESGKCLGKGYKTKEEAQKRLKQVEYFKHKKSLKSIVISKMATDLKDIPESVKKNVLSDLVYVILTGKGSFAYKTVANKLKGMLVELGYADKLKANEDGSLPTLEIVEQIAKEPKVMELAGKFANIAQIKASKKTIISKLAENEKIDWDHIWGIEYNGKKYMLHENMGTLYSFINMEDLKNNKITNKSYITFNMMQITKKVKEGKMLVIYDY